MLMAVAIVGGVLWWCDSDGNSMTSSNHDTAIATTIITAREYFYG
jgi:hypothetical protein